MSDTVTLRDHTHPCEHLDRTSGLQRGAWWGGPSTPLWFCHDVTCPGGREVTLRREKAYIAGIARTVWVEVPDEQ